MKKSVLVFAFILIQNVVFAQKNFLDQAYLETSARVDTLVVPDRIYLAININEADSKNKKSVEVQEKEMETELKKLGIRTEKDLVMQDLASNFKNYLFKRQNVLKSKSYELLVRDAVMAGKVLIALEKIGISNTHIARVEYSKEEELVLELKTQAVAKAKMKAEKMAKPLGQKVGKAVYISDTNHSQYGDIYPEAYIAAKAEYAPEPIDIEIKKIKFEGEVSVKFLLD